ncbi:tyrosine-type recombinase/integrase [Magnetovibrio blakemorei]|uniref:Integrase n=1 Tax=Magnetovibrio blakemorei TaxID=28181 RepID=A0A1E5Q3C4_9PROT|nr:site-specific integrase [Magnetovibrio blakemorei]OEJ64133.1 integrase [Magnetovibrio blakemorei]
MAQGIHRLTDKQIKNASKDLNDGGNLWLLIRRETKVWAFRYMLNGKSRKAGLGSYPTVSLAMARETASQYRQWLSQGIDPLDQKDKQQAEASKVMPTFTSAAARFILTNRHEWKSRKHARQWISTIRTYAKPKIGKKLVSDVSTEDVQAILSPIWTSKTETAKRVQGRIERVLDWATAMKYRTGENPARWSGNLDQIYPSPNKVKKLNNGGNENHQSALPYQDLPAFYDGLKDKDGNSVKALKFLILTACRSGEVLNATWDEIDLANKTWTIPASRMKAGSEHRIPLTDKMIGILESVPRFSDFVFAGNRHNRPLSGMAMLTMMRKMGYVKGGQHPAYVPHGFRSSFRDWCEEQSSAPHGVIERALAHTIRDATERAYNRGDLFDKRRSLMQSWGQFVADQRNNVITMTRDVS